MAERWCLREMRVWEGVEIFRRRWRARVWTEGALLFACLLQLQLQNVTVMIERARIFVLLRTRRPKAGTVKE